MEYTVIQINQKTVGRRPAPVITDFVKQPDALRKGTLSFV